ncbi:hypothetical protein [Winogradskyella sp. A2]
MRVITISVVVNYHDFTDKTAIESLLMQQNKPNFPLLSNNKEND